VGLVLNLNWLFTIDTFECKTAAAGGIAIVNRINFPNSAICNFFFLSRILYAMIKYRGQIYN